MHFIGARLGDHIDLAACLGAIFRVIESAVDTVFLDCVLRNLQTCLRLLSLFLDAACVNAVNLKIVVVARPASETNGSLIATPIILGEGREQSETSPVAPIVRKIGDLIGVNDGGRLGGAAIRRA